MKEYRGGMIMHDMIERIGSASVIQHGKQNDRIYLMKLDSRDASDILNNLAELASGNSYTKVFCKVPEEFAPLFIADGYILEAFIPEFFNRKKDVFFLSKFTDRNRMLNPERKVLNEFSSTLFNKPEIGNDLYRKTEGYRIRKLGKQDVDQITAIYKMVFETYPFPVFDPSYITKTMDENIQYFGADKDGELAALSSAEIDFSGENAEMTDFATHPSHTGKNLAVLLLSEMEREMKKQGIKTLYTIARLASVAMNRTFLKYNYRYSGTLIKNTNISGRIESMNVLYKHL